MKTVTVEEAGTGLERWVDLALAGEQIQITKGDAAVELRPTKQISSGTAMSPREALRYLQSQSRLTVAEADAYLRELREERFAAEDGLPG